MSAMLQIPDGEGVQHVICNGRGRPVLVLRSPEGMEPTPPEEIAAYARRFVSADNSHDALVAALTKSAEGWDNAIELGLIPERHRNTAAILRDEARAALRLAREGGSNAE